MAIITSSIVSKVAQQGGTVSIVEQHVDDQGKTYDYSYVCASDVDTDKVLADRADKLSAELEAERVADQIANNYEIPLTPLTIMRRLTPQEWYEFQTSTDPTIEYFKAVFNRTTSVYRNDPLTLAGFGMLVQTGILTEARVQEILS